MQSFRFPRSAILLMVATFLTILAAISLATEMARTVQTEYAGANLPAMWWSRLPGMFVIVFLLFWGIGTAIGPQIKRIALLVFYVPAVLATAVYPLLLRIELRGVSEPFSGHGFAIVRYAESVTSFMLAFGLMCTGWYLCVVAGYLNISFLNLIRALWPFVASPFFGLASLVILFQTSSSMPVNWVIPDLLIGVVLYCILGVLTVRVFYRLSRN